MTSADNQTDMGEADTNIDVPSEDTDELLNERLPSDILPKKILQNHIAMETQVNEDIKYETEKLTELTRQCDSLKEQCDEILVARDETENEEPTNTRLTNPTATNGMLFYGSETSINTVISNPCSDTSSQNTQNSSECSSNSMISASDNSFDSSEAPFNNEVTENQSDSVSEHDDVIEVKWDILREAERRKKKSSKSSDKSDKCRTTSEKSSIMHLNMNIRKLLSKLKTTKTHDNKKTKTKKSKGSSVTSSNSDDSGSITTTRVYSASHVEWYTNLFKDSISSDSSDSDDDEKPKKTRKTKKSNSIRGKISVDFEMHKEKIRGSHDNARLGITENENTNTDHRISNTDHRNISYNNDETQQDVKTIGSYANIRKTNAVELQKSSAVYRASRRKCIQTEQQKNNLNNLDTMYCSFPDNNNNNNNKNENVLCRPDKTPLISRYTHSHHTYYDDSNMNTRTQPSVHYDKRPFSVHEDHYRTFSHEQYSEQTNMIASFDFIASEDLEVTVLTGQQVEILLKPDPDWWWVRTPDGKEGFVPKNFLNVIPTVPNRKSDLIKKLMSIHYNPDSDVFEKPDCKPEIRNEHRNQVRLPTRVKFSESPRLAKVAPLMREVVVDEGKDTCAKYNMYDGETKENINKRLPPPSYSEHINNTFADMIGQYCETMTTTTTLAHDTPSDDDNLSGVPRVLRRRSFSGNKQKKVHFSNKIATAYLQDTSEYNNVGDRYGLDMNMGNYNDAVSYC